MLPPYEAPPPPPPASCPGCEAFRPECLVPGELFGQDEPVPMCWFCAHLVTEHDAAELGPDTVTKVAARCDCPGHKIYPWAAEVAARNAATEAPVEPVPRWREGSAMAKATRQRRRAV